MKVVIDTNVILDVWLARDPFFIDSARVLSAAEIKTISGVICPTTVTTLHYIVKKYRGEAKARELLESILKICSVGVFRKMEVMGALNSEITDFEDAVVESVALKTGANFIVTRNLADFKKSRVPVVEPSRLGGTDSARLE